MYFFSIYAIQEFVFDSVFDVHPTLEARLHINARTARTQFFEFTFYHFLGWKGTDLSLEVKSVLNSLLLFKD